MSHNIMTATTTTNESESDIDTVYYPASTSTTTCPLQAYHSQYATSIQDVSTYWSNLATSLLDWYAPFPTGLSGSLQDGSTGWFTGGKLNVCHNAIDRYCAAPYHRGAETALLWEGDEPTSTLRWSYLELRDEVCRIANALAASGVRRGDVVTLYMPMVPELAMTMLACARIGAVHSVIFAGFSADAIADRVRDAQSRWVVTAASGSRGGAGPAPEERLRCRHTERQLCGDCRAGICV